MAIHEDPKEFVTATAGWAFRRVFLIANNPNIDATFLRKYEITPDDCIIQFNNAVKFDDISEINCHKIFVFNLSDVKAGHRGFDDDGTFSRDYSAGKSVSVTYIFPFKISDPVKPAVSVLPESIAVYCYHPAAFRIRFDLPDGKSPTVGYKIAWLLNLLNGALKKNGKAAMEVYWVGFDASLVTKSPKFVHNFSHEHDVISSWSNFVRIQADGTEATR